MSTEKDKFNIRVELVKMAFAQTGAYGAHQILKDWKLKSLYKLLNPLYYFMEEQREVIVKVIDQKVEDIKSNMQMIVQRFNTLIKCTDAQNDSVNLIKMMINFKKELSKEDFTMIKEEEPLIKEFFKELRVHKNQYSIK